MQLNQKIAWIVGGGRNFYFYQDSQDFPTLLAQHMNGNSMLPP